MHVLVTGGAGYLGSVVAQQLLRNGHTVRVLDSLRYGGTGLLPLVPDDGFSFLRGDIRSPEAISEALTGADAVVHLAAVGGDPICARDPVLCRTVNIDASRELLRAVARSQVQRLVFASSCSVYGVVGDDDAALNEDSPIRPLSLYAESKATVEDLLLGSIGGNCTVIVLRFATLFGVSPRMRFDLTVNEFTMELLTSRALRLFAEDAWRPYVHVGDAARAIATVLQAPQHLIDGEVFNVGSNEQNHQKRQLVEMIRRHLGHPVDIYRATAVADRRNYRVAFDKLTERLGFRATKTVDDGIGEVTAVVRDGLIADVRAGQYRN